MRDVDLLHCTTAKAHLIQHPFSYRDWQQGLQWEVQDQTRQEMWDMLSPFIDHILVFYT